MFSEIDIGGAFVSPLAPLALVTWGLVATLRIICRSLGMFDHVWHPALLTFSIYLLLLSGILLFVSDNP